MNQIVQNLYKGMTYYESWSFVFVNYSLLLVSLVPFFVIRHEKFGKSIRITLWIAIAIQVAFWLTLQAVGISIIWNTMLGALMVDFILFRKHLNKQNWLVIGLAMLILLSADIYYLITLPIITSIAHLAAILLGIICKRYIRYKTA